MSNKRFNPNIVRAHFVARGTNYHAWAREQSFTPQHVYQVINGLRGNGPKARVIRKALEKEVGR